MDIIESKLYTKKTTPRKKSIQKYECSITNFINKAFDFINVTITLHSKKIIENYCCPDFLEKMIFPWYFMHLKGLQG